MNGMNAMNCITEMHGVNDMNDMEDRCGQHLQTQVQKVCFQAEKAAFQTPGPGWLPGVGGVGGNKLVPRKKVCLWRKNKRAKRGLKGQFLAAKTKVLARKRTVSGQENKRSQERLRNIRKKMECRN